MKKEKTFGQAISPISFGTVEILEIILSKDVGGNNVVQAMYELISDTGMKTSKWIIFQASDFGPLQLQKIDKIFEIVDNKVMAYLESLQT
jgi:hypothetical protein